MYESTRPSNAGHTDKHHWKYSVYLLNYVCTIEDTECAVCDDKLIECLLQIQGL